MNSTPDFILEADQFFSFEECGRYIDYYEKMQELGFCENRMDSYGILPHNVSDHQLFIHNEESVKLPSNLTHTFLERFWSDIYPVYRNTYSVIGESPPHKIFNIKLQKTAPGEGYHTWHYEAASRPVYNRLLFFILYLNTIEEGGETEFLYYKKRIKAKTGKLIVAPCSFTHTHRGNPPLEEDKYILTGWVEYE